MIDLSKPHRAGKGADGAPVRLDLRFSHTYLPPSHTFSHLLLCAAQVRLDHRSGYAQGNHEDGYLAGLDNMIAIFEELPQTPHMAHSHHTVHLLPLGALLIWCTVCGTGRQADLPRLRLRQDAHRQHL